jgi:hypothetical protein
MLTLYENPKKTKNMVFMEDDVSIVNALEIRPSARNEGLTTVFDDGVEHNEQMRDHLVANEETIKILRRMMAIMRNLVRIDDILRGNGIHLKNGGTIKILCQHNEERTNVTFLDDYLNL